MTDRERIDEAAAQDEVRAAARIRELIGSEYRCKHCGSESIDQHAQDCPITALRNEQDRLFRARWAGRRKTRR